MSNTITFDVPHFFTYGTRTKVRIKMGLNNFMMPLIQGASKLVRTFYLIKAKKDLMKAATVAVFYVQRQFASSTLMENALA